MCRHIVPLFQRNFDIHRRCYQVHRSPHTSDWITHDSRINLFLQLLLNQMTILNSRVFYHDCMEFARVIPPHVGSPSQNALYSTLELFNVQMMNNHVPFKIYRNDLLFNFTWSCHPTCQTDARGPTTTMHVQCWQGKWPCLKEVL